MNIDAILAAARQTNVPFRYAKGAAALVMAAFEAGTSNFSDGASDAGSASSYRVANDGTTSGLPVSTSTGNYCHQQSKSSIGNLADLVGFPESPGSLANLQAMADGNTSPDYNNNQEPAFPGAELTVAQVTKLAQPMYTLLSTVDFYSIMGNSTQVVVVDVDASLGTAFIAAQESRVTYLLLRDPQANANVSDSAAAVCVSSSVSTGAGKFCGVFTMEDVMMILLYCHARPVEVVERVCGLTIREAKMQDWMKSRRQQFNDTLISGHPEMNVLECFRRLIEVNQGKTEEGEEQGNKTGYITGSDPLPILTDLSPDQIDVARDTLATPDLQGGEVSVVGVLTWPILLSQVGRMLVHSGEICDVAGRDGKLSPRRAMSPSTPYKTLYEVPIRDLPKLGRFLTGYRMKEQIDPLLDDDSKPAEGNTDQADDDGGGDLGIEAALARAERASIAGVQQDLTHLPLLTRSNSVAQVLAVMYHFALDAVPIVAQINDDEMPVEDGSMGGIATALAEDTDGQASNKHPRFTIVDVFSIADILRLEYGGSFNLAISMEEALNHIRGLSGTEVVSGGTSTPVCTLDDSFGDVLAHFCNTSVKEMFVVSHQVLGLSNDPLNDNDAPPPVSSQAAPYLIGQLGLREVLTYLYKACTGTL